MKRFQLTGLREHDGDGCVLFCPELNVARQRAQCTTSSSKSLLVLLSLLLLLSVSAFASSENDGISICVDASATSRNGFMKGASPIAGGDGGSVSVRTCAAIDIGDGHLGTLATNNVQPFKDGVHAFYEITAGCTVLQLEGTNIEIRTQLQFAPWTTRWRIPAASFTPRLRINAGDTGGQFPDTHNAHNLNLVIEYIGLNGVSDPPVSRGPDIEFNTASCVRLDSCWIQSNGSIGYNGGTNGVGGRISVCCPKRGVNTITVNANGGSGGSAYSGERGMQGGSGGALTLTGEWLEGGLTCNLRGGDAWTPSGDAYATNIPQRAFDGPKGGDGGTATLQFHKYVAGRQAAFDLAGGNGASGADGAQGTSGSSSQTPGNGQPGGNGGAGGLGGTLTGLWPGYTFRGIAGSGGYGGAGGHGGYYYGTITGGGADGGLGGAAGGSGGSGGNGGRGGSGTSQGAGGQTRPGNGGTGGIAGKPFDAVTNISWTWISGQYQLLLRTNHIVPHAGNGGNGGGNSSGTGGRGGDAWQPSGVPGRGGNYNSVPPAIPGASGMNLGLNEVEERWNNLNPLNPCAIQPPLTNVWRVYYYMAADVEDTNLWTDIFGTHESSQESAALNHINRIETCTNLLCGDAIKVAVMLDRVPIDVKVPFCDPASTNWSVSQWGPIVYDDNLSQIASPIRFPCGNLTEMNTANPDTLRGWLDWAPSFIEKSFYYPDIEYWNYHRVLVLDGHGRNTLGILMDSHIPKTNEPSWMQLYQLEKGLAGHYYDVINFQLCNSSSLELAATVATNAAYMVGTQGFISGFALKPVPWISFLGESPDATAQEAARAIWNANSAHKYLSVIDLSRIPPICDKLNTLVSSLLSLPANVTTNIMTNLRQTITYRANGVTRDVSEKDAGALMDGIVDQTTNIYPGIATLAASIAMDVRAATSNRWSQSRGRGVPSGLNLTLPLDNVTNYLQGVALSRYSTWTRWPELYRFIAVPPKCDWACKLSSWFSVPAPSMELGGDLIMASLVNTNPYSVTMSSIAFTSVVGSSIITIPGTYLPLTVPPNGTIAVPVLRPFVSPQPISLQMVFYGNRDGSELARVPIQFSECAEGMVLENRMEGSVFTAVYRGGFGKSYRVEYSRDLIAWVLLGRVICDDGTVTVRDSDSHQQTARFFRVIAE